MKILFATDGSANAQQAAKFLSKIDFENRYELILVTISYDPTLSTHDYFAWAEEWREEEAKRVETAHDEIVELLRGKCERVKRVHKIGAPPREILHVAKEEVADLIVIGAVGHSAVRRLVLGSVSDHVATEAECSVMVVRPHELKSNEPLERIMIAFDGSEPAKSVIQELEKYGLSRESEVSITTVLHEYDYMAGDGMAATLYQRQTEWFEKQRADNHDAAGQLKNSFPNVRSLVKQSASPDDTLVNLAANNDSQLMMVGDAGHTFLDELMMGSTTKYILRHAPCSVWISRHHRTADKVQTDAKGETARV